MEHRSNPPSQHRPADQILGEALQSLPVAVVVSDADNRIWFVNDCAAALFKTAPSQAVGTALDSWVTQRPGEKDPGAAALRKPLALDVMIHPAIGATLPACCSSRWIQLGEANLGCHVLWDVSEQTARETSLRAEIACFRAIFEMLPDAVITTDAKGCIETFNLAAEPMFQVTAEEVAGESIQRLLPQIAAGAGKNRQAAARTLLGNGLPPRKARRKDGSSFPVELAVGEMNVCGRNLIAWVLKDITNRVQAEQQAQEARERLIQAEKMASLGSLVAGIAHEINTPLGISVTAASHLREHGETLLRSYREGGLKRSELESYFDQAAEASRILETNLRRASDLIRGFKQIAVDRSNNERRRFNVREFLAELLLSLRPRLKKTSHRIEVLCAADLVITSYPGALSQVLTNLVINSLVHGFAPQTAGTLCIRVEETERWVRLWYSDDGKGIPETLLHRVFEPFFTTRRGHGGSGLGLHIVYNLVTRALSGSIECTAREGQGTAFEISFPDLTGEPEP